MCVAVRCGNRRACSHARVPYPTVAVRGFRIRNDVCASFVNYESCNVCLQLYKSVSLIRPRPSLLHSSVMIWALRRPAVRLCLAKYTGSSRAYAIRFLSDTLRMMERVSWRRPSRRGFIFERRSDSALPGSVARRRAAVNELRDCCSGGNSRQVQLMRNARSYAYVPKVFFIPPRTCRNVSLLPRGLFLFFR